MVSFFGLGLAIGLAGFMIFRRQHAWHLSALVAIVTPLCLWGMTIPWHHVPAWAPSWIPVASTVVGFWVFLWWSNSAPILKWLYETPLSLHCILCILGYLYFSAFAMVYTSSLLLGIGLLIMVGMGCPTDSTEYHPHRAMSPVYTSFQVTRWSYIAYTHSMGWLLWKILPMDEVLHSMLRPWMLYYMPVVLVYTYGCLLSPNSSASTWWPYTDRFNGKPSLKTMAVSRISVMMILCLTIVFGQQGNPEPYETMGLFVLVTWLSLAWLLHTLLGWFRLGFTFSPTKHP